MSEGPLRCHGCGHTDFIVISNGVTYKGGTIVEMYRWPGELDDADGLAAELGEAYATYGGMDSGYRVDQEILRDPEMESVEGPVRALCASCLTDVTGAYLALGRREAPLPM